MTHHLKELPDADLIRLCAQNHRDAWEEFFTRYYSFILLNAQKYIHYYRVHEIDPEDVVQEVSRKLMFAIRRDGIKKPEPGYLHSYIKVMTRNTVIDMGRKEKHRAHFSIESAELENFPAERDNKAGFWAKVKLVEEALDNPASPLTDLERAILKLTIEGKQAHEIAAALQTKVNILYVLKSRAIMKLKNFLSGREE